MAGESRNVTASLEEEQQREHGTTARRQLGETSDDRRAQRLQRRLRLRSSICSRSRRGCGAAVPKAGVLHSGRSVLASDRSIPSARSPRRSSVDANRCTRLRSVWEVVASMRWLAKQVTEWKVTLDASKGRSQGRRRWRHTTPRDPRTKKRVSSSFASIPLSPANTYALPSARSSFSVSSRAHTFNTASWALERHANTLLKTRLHGVVANERHQRFSLSRQEAAPDDPQVAHMHRLPRRRQHHRDAQLLLRNADEDAQAGRGHRADQRFRSRGRSGEAAGGGTPAGRPVAAVRCARGASDARREGDAAEWRRRGLEDCRAQRTRSLGEQGDESEPSSPSREEGEGTVGAESEEEVVDGVVAETLQREAAQERGREDLQGGGGLDAEIVEEGDLGVRRGRRSNARLVEELAETAVGAAKKDTARGGANEVHHRETLNGNDGVHGDD